MESEILRKLKKDCPTTEAQWERLITLVDNFGNLSETEMKFTIGDILCLAKLLYEEANDKRIVRNVQRRILDLEDVHEDDAAYMEKLDYLKRCLTNFKPAIFRNIQMYFAELYKVDFSLVTCLPKVVGQQVGAKAEIKQTPDDTNPILFHVKTHQEFCSKSHPQLVVITSDGTGKVDFKELFIYQVLQYIGYGPKVHFIIDRDIVHSRIEEGILIATQDLGYTKRPEQRAKSFKIFREVRDDLSHQPVTGIDEATRRDIIAIDMLSRALLLEDVMVNQGNFGIMAVDSKEGEPSAPTIKWKVLDFISPPLRTEAGDDYSYARHYPHGRDIFHSFRIGNASHTYDREGLEILNQILLEEHAKDLWLPVAERLSSGDTHHVPIAEAFEKAFIDIESFMRENAEILQIKPDRMERRMKDLEAYKEKITENFTALEQGVREYCSAETSTISQPK